MFRIVICDDEPLMRERLHGFLQSYAKQQQLEFEVRCFESANVLLQDYPRDTDLIFMDIGMDGMDGMTAARQIRTFDSSVCMIFITTLYQRAIDGYAVRAFGFIRKPVSRSELSHELGCALAQIENQKAREQFISIKDANGLCRLPISHISYCEVKNHNVRICMDGEIREYRYSMSKLEELLLPLGFFRCHSSYLVNGSKIRKLEQTQLFLTDGSCVPISQRRRKEFIQQISSYLGDKI